MAYKVIYTEGGQKSYNHTVDYFVNVLESPHIAVRWMEAVKKAQRQLEIGADSYPICEEKKLASRKIRKVHLKKYKYKVYYHIVGDSEVHIDAILHDRQTPEKWLV